MKVILYFDFPTITDADSPEADQVVEGLTDLCVSLRNDMIDEYPGLRIHVDEAYTDEQPVFHDKELIK